MNRKAIMIAACLVVVVGIVFVLASASKGGNGTRPRSVWSVTARPSDARLSAFPAEVPPTVSQSPSANCMCGTGSGRRSSSTMRFQEAGPAMRTWSVTRPFWGAYSSHSVSKVGFAWMFVETNGSDPIEANLCGVNAGTTST